MADSHESSTLKELSEKIDKQALSFHQMMQQFMTAVDAHFDEIRSKIPDTPKNVPSSSKQPLTVPPLSSSPSDGRDLSPMVKSMKMEVPRFDGSDPHSWQDIRRELLFNRPTTLMATFAMARALEAKFNDIKPHTRSWSKWQPQSTFPSMPTAQTRTVPLPLLSHSHSSTISANPPSSKPPPPHIHNKTNTLPALLPTPNLPIRRLSPAELHERREKGLCYSCDQKYSPNHRCNRRFLLLIGAEDDHLDPTNEGEPPDEEDSAVTGDISSLNALAGQANPRSLRLQGKIGSQTFQILIDSSSTHNFIKPSVAERAGVAIQPTTPFRVYIGNGADIVLGIQWLQQLGRIRVHSRDIYKTAFRTHEGHYEFLIMPFGLTNAPSTFQAAMNQNFAAYLQKFVIVFFDDILVYSATMADHLVHLEQVLLCLQMHQFFVKLSKCLFCKSSIEYLGHIISAMGVQADPQKVTAMLEWPLPQSTKQLRGFLGLTGYYRRFIRGYASLAAPLTDLLCKDAFHWNSEATTAFASLKQAMVQAPVLKLPDFDSEFVIETDASNVGIGAVLMQQGHLVAYFSKKIGPKLKASSTYLKELHAIVQVVSKWRQYLLGRFFVIRTDHRSIKELLQQVIQTPDQQVYLQKLLSFQFRIDYKPGHANRAADALSRVHAASDEIEPIDSKYTSSFCLSLHSSPSFNLLTELLRENSTCHDILKLHHQVSSGHFMADYSIHNGILLYKGKYYLSAESSLKIILLKEFHSTPLARHVGIHRIYLRLSANFFWVHMRQDVEKFVTECLICQQKKYSTKAPAGLLQPLHIPSLVWDEITMDFITGLPLSRGYSAILAVVDRLKKSAHFGPLPSNFTAHKTVKLFVEIVVKIHGFPSSIISDRDPVFLSQFWNRLLTLSGTSLHYSMASHPQTDGQREALFGRLPPTIPPYVKSSTSIQALDDILLERDKLLKSLKDNLRQAQHRMAQKANTHRREVQFSVGDKVLVKLQPYRRYTVASRSCHKLAKRYYGPFVVIARIGPVAYKLELPLASKIHPIFHVSLLKPFHGSTPQEISPLPEYSIDNHPLTLPAVIYATRIVFQQGKLVPQVLVQWTDGAPENATWENFRVFCQQYPAFNLEDKFSFQEGENDTGLPIELDAKDNLPRDDEEAKTVTKEPNNEFAEAKQQLNCRPERAKKHPS
ncbi:hypothetical protein KPL70_008268 [Citrus sinensis]|nr:hypothetical protein KPL70_008268 [Citrus sinensis]